MDGRYGFPIIRTHHESTSRIGIGAMAILETPVKEETPLGGDTGDLFLLTGPPLMDG